MTRLFPAVMMNCEQEIDADKAGGNETLIPLQGFGFFSPCALEKIQSLFEVCNYINYNFYSEGKMFPFLYIKLIHCLYKYSLYL